MEDVHGNVFDVKRAALTVGSVRLPLLFLQAGLLFDNAGTVFLSVFMSLWAVTFLEYWKRTSSALSHRWDCSDFQDIAVRPRLTRPPPENHQSLNWPSIFVRSVLVQSLPPWRQ